MIVNILCFLIGMITTAIIYELLSKPLLGPLGVNHSDVAKMEGTETTKVKDD